MSKRLVEIDLLIVGGGLLGMSVALLASDHNYRVLVCRMSDADVPQAETLRNQGWLQSGIRYFDEGDLQKTTTFARRMRAAGRQLHWAVGMEPPSGLQGIFRVRNEAEADRFRGRATSLGIDIGDPLAPDMAKGAVGPLFVPGAIYIRTPEVPFDEAAILTAMRDIVQARKGYVMDLDQPVELLPKPSVARGFVVRIGADVFDPPTTVLTAGAGNVPMLTGLGMTDTLTLTQTPLLVVPSVSVVPTPGIFVDRVDRFSIVTHPSSQRVPGGAMIIGVDGFSRLTKTQPSSERKISSEDANQIWERLPPTLRQHRGVSRFTAGVEVGVRGEENHARPWVAKVPKYVGLVAAVPGRATLCYSVAANDIMPLLTELQPAVVPLCGNHSAGEMLMHFEPYYNSLNDAEETNST